MLSFDLTKKEDRTKLVIWLIENFDQGFRGYGDLDESLDPWECQIGSVDDMRFGEAAYKDLANYLTSLN